MNEEGNGFPGWLEMLMWFFLLLAVGALFLNGGCDSPKITTRPATQPRIIRELEVDRVEIIIMEREYQ